MTPKTESNARYVKGVGLAVLSIALLFLGLWSLARVGLDNSETVTPLNYAMCAWIALIGSFLCGCGTGAVLSPRKTRISSTVAAGTAWFLASVAILAGGGGEYKSSGPGPPCVINMILIGTSLQLYASDNDDQLPSDKWMDRLVPYANRHQDYRCPAVNAPGYGYAMAKAFLGRKMQTIAANEILAYDSKKLERNSVGDIKQDFATRHHDKGTVLFADGHAKHMSAAELR